jgi:hypothetical protein
LTESLYDISAEAQNDLFEIWVRIAEDSIKLANRIETEFLRIVCFIRPDADTGTRPKRPHRPACFVLSTVFISGCISTGSAACPNLGRTARQAQSEADTQRAVVAVYSGVNGRVSEPTRISLVTI